MNRRVCPSIWRDVCKTYSNGEALNVFSFNVAESEIFMTIVLISVFTRAPIS
jgi:hypothetical protein